MIEWDTGETTIERLSINTGDDPFVCDLYIDEKHLLWALLFTLMLRCIVVTLNYPILKYTKDFIIAYFREYKHHNVFRLSYGILTLE